MVRFQTPVRFGFRTQSTPISERLIDYTMRNFQYLFVEMRIRFLRRLLQSCKPPVKTHDRKKRDMSAACS